MGPCGLVSGGMVCVTMTRTVEDTASSSLACERTDVVVSWFQQGTTTIDQKSRLKDTTHTP
jgi:hypothetical protein